VGFAGPGVGAPAQDSHSIGVLIEGIDSVAGLVDRGVQRLPKLHLRGVPHGVYGQHSILDGTTESDVQLAVVAVHRAERAGGVAENHHAAFIDLEAPGLGVVGVGGQQGGVDHPQRRRKRGVGVLPGSVRGAPFDEAPGAACQDARRDGDGGGHPPPGQQKGATRSGRDRSGHGDSPWRGLHSTPKSIRSVTFPRKIRRNAESIDPSAVFNVFSDRGASAPRHYSALSRHS
jgi:hypothetical protein